MVRSVSHGKVYSVSVYRTPEAAGTPIANDSFIVDGVGALGNLHTERGLTYVEISLSGHMYAALALGPKSEEG